MFDRLRLASLIVGSVLFALSTFFWSDGRYGLVGGMLVFYGIGIWAYGLLGVWERIGASRPWLGAVGVLATLLGMLGGVAFGLQGFFGALFDVSAQESLDASAEHPVATGLVLWLLGPILPGSFVLMGLALRLTRLAPTVIAVLVALGGVLFPLGRATRVEFIALSADLFLVPGFFMLALALFRPGRVAVTPDADR
ncbi:hypothetical protein [Streptomyces himalayensis]|uniref:Uncharacterized protein n=1 Tax=Streptomyces himalayensis subsp. himalayensis TaxID=2756131 RepID=A0A7W0I7J6_9ACTN|nr:hypothetical protein [Streptomyces himalayensis]MBA2945228.1 hypothetical protein [Streptomyces himalayensis subsp. himalayensis]